MEKTSKVRFGIDREIRKYHDLSEDNEKAIFQFQDSWNKYYPYQQIIKVGKIIEVDKNDIVWFEATVRINK